MAATLSAYPDKGEQSAVFEIYDPADGHKRVVPRKDVISRVIRRGDPVPEEQEWENSTPEERINAVWDLTLLCLAWQNVQTDEPRLQRSVSRIQRPGR